MREQDAELREMARHRGFRLVKSRRRKPGGDFGCYGLEDLAGKPAFGFDDGGLTADAGQIEAFLRDTVRATWTSSAGSAKRAPRAKPAPPKPRPLPKLDVANLFERLPSARRGEVFTELLTRTGFKLERIVSHGQSTPEDAPMVQDRDEWVVVLQGSARLRVQGHREAALEPGDHVLIAAGTQHWVTWTSKDVPTLWLAFHFD